MRLYPKVVVVGKSFVNEKNVVIPNQSMSLKEIIQRFTRRESLPIEQEGIYNEDAGDLEKIAREDIVERHERAAELKSRIEKAEKRKAEKEAADKAKAEQDAKDVADLKEYRDSKLKNPLSSVEKPPSKE